MSALEFSPADSPVEEAVRTILGAQHASGMIPWFVGGSADAWNHVEAMMALVAADEIDAAQRAFSWLAEAQREDGSWAASYDGDGMIVSSRTDTNAVAYAATGAWHYYLSTTDLHAAESMFPVVERALDFVCAQRRSDGMLPWSIESDGSPATGSLLAATSSVHQSLRSGCALAAALGLKRPAWSAAAAGLAELVVGRERDFLDKSLFAMDWYYPVLAGVLRGEPARERLRAGTSRFVLPECGVRCRADGEWVTMAETAECAIAHWLAGNREEAWTLIDWALSLRRDDGSFRTGVVYPQGSEFPLGETTTYSAAAVVLAVDVCTEGNVGEAFADMFSAA